MISVWRRWVQPPLLPQGWVPQPQMLERGPQGDAVQTCGSCEMGALSPLKLSISLDKSPPSSPATLLHHRGCTWLWRQPESTTFQKFLFCYFFLSTFLLLVPLRPGPRKPLHTDQLANFSYFESAAFLSHKVISSLGLTNWKVTLPFSFF